MPAEDGYANKCSVAFCLKASGPAIKNVSARAEAAFTFIPPELQVYKSEWKITGC